MDPDATRWSVGEDLSNVSHAPWLLPALVRLSIAGLLAIGASGGVAAAMGAIYGRPFVSGDAPGVTYSKGRCADYLEYEPDAHSCEQAATRHHYGETVGYRSDAGILGLLVLGGYLFYRRRRRAPLAPRAFSATVATAAFSLAAVVLLAPGLYSLAQGRRVGVGDYLSAGLVSALAAVISGVRLVWGGRRQRAGKASR